MRLSQEYRLLLSKLRSQWERHPLKRFIRYCSDRNLPAQQIRESTFEAFKKYVHQRTLLGDPKRVTSLTRRAWNKAARTVSGWPQVHFKEDGQRQRPNFILRSSFVSELARYRRFMEGSGPSPSGQTKTASYRTSTITHRCQLVRQFGKILARKQHSPGSLSDLVDPTNAALILHALRSESGAKLKSIYERAVFLRHLAKVWCKSSTSTLNALLDLERKYIPPYRGRAERSFRLAKILFDPERRDQILRLPRDMLRAAESPRYEGPRAALRAQIAAALELMLVAPLWPMNLARLRIGETLIKERRMGRAIYRISIPRSDVHNDRPLEYTLPPSSSALLDRYVLTFRAQLCAPSIQWLFPGRGDKPKQVSAFSSQITEYVRRATGIHLTVSSLRYFVGAIFLLRNPGAHEVVRQALGHKSLQTTYEMYRDLDSIEAARRFDEKVLNASRAMA